MSKQITFHIAGGANERSSYNFSVVTTEDRNQLLSPTLSINDSLRQITSTVNNQGITLQNNGEQLSNTNPIQQRGWTLDSSIPINPNSHDINLSHLKQELIDTPRLQASQIFIPKEVQISNNSDSLISNSVQIGNELISSTQMKKKKNEQRLLEEHEKQQIVEEMTNSKLGEMCPVCYKIFRNKDALEFHIMNTKMSGHEQLVQQRVKNHSSATETSTTQPELGLTMPSLDEPSLDMISRIFDTNQCKAQSEAEEGGMIDPKTGMLRNVKQEPLTDHEPTPMLVSPKEKKSKIGDGERGISSKPSETVLYPRNTKTKEKQGKEAKNITNNAKTAQKYIDTVRSSNTESTESKLMPPPLETRAIRKSNPTSLSKIFKCFECNRAFKKEMKLIKHVTRKHSRKKNSANCIESNILTSSKLVNSSINQIDNPVIPGKNTESLPSNSEDYYHNQNGDLSKEDNEKSSLKFSPMGCPDCVMLFSTKDDMMLHFARPPHRLMCNLNVNKCPVLTCDVSFATKSKLLDHLVAGKHGQPCPQCGKEFPKVS